MWLIYRTANVYGISYNVLVWYLIHTTHVYDMSYKLISNCNVKGPRIRVDLTIGDLLNIPVHCNAG